MKITRVTTRVLRTPADNPLVVGRPAPTDTREFVTLRLFEETPALENGQLVVPRRPGLGLTFDAAALARYQVG